jgi:hypothetical protein
MHPCKFEERGSWSRQGQVVLDSHAMDLARDEEDMAHKADTAAKSPAVPILAFGASFLVRTNLLELVHPPDRTNPLARNTRSCQRASFPGLLPERRFDPVERSRGGLHLLQLDSQHPVGSRTLILVLDPSFPCWPPLNRLEHPRAASCVGLMPGTTAHLAMSEWPLLRIA